MDEHAQSEPVRVVRTTHSELVAVTFYSMIALLSSVVSLMGARWPAYLFVAAVSFALSVLMELRPFLRSVAYLRTGLANVLEMPEAVVVANPIRYWLGMVIRWDRRSPLFGLWMAWTIVLVLGVIADALPVALAFIAGSSLFTVAAQLYVRLVQMRWERRNHAQLYESSQAEPTHAWYASRERTALQ